MTTILNTMQGMSCYRIINNLNASDYYNTGSIAKTLNSLTIILNIKMVQN